MTTGCPQFEELSQFVDGEIDGARAAAVETHVANCRPCAQIAGRLGRIIEAGAAEAHRSAPGCSSAEMLIAYLAGTLGGDERRRIERHLDACDCCVESLALMQRPLAAAPAIAAAVPVAVQRRALTAFQDEVAPRRGQTRTREVQRVFQIAREALGNLLRLPVLVPVAVAVAVLMIATQRDWRGAPQEMSRSIHMAQSRRITASEAVVRARPSSRSEAVATLKRGDAVEVRDEERTWLRVVLADGKEGWVEVAAFE